MRPLRIAIVATLALAAAASVAAQCTAPILQPLKPDQGGPGLPAATQELPYSVTVTSNMPVQWVGTASPNSSGTGFNTTPLTGADGLNFIVVSSTAVVLAGVPLQSGTFNETVTGISTSGSSQCFTTLNYELTVNMPAGSGGGTGGGGGGGGVISVTLGQPVPFTSTLYSFIAPFSTSGLGSDTVTNTVTALGPVSNVNYLPNSPAGFITGIATGPATLTLTVEDTVSNMTATATVTISLPSLGSTQLVTVNDPIAISTGELSDFAIPPDLSLGGPLPLIFQRTYASLLDAAPNPNGASARLGNNWTQNFAWSLNLTAPYAAVVSPDGFAVLFQQSGSAWQVVGSEKYDYQLTTLLNGDYQFLDPRTNLIYTFTTGSGTALALISIQDRNGNTLTLTQPQNSASQVTDGLGRTLSFTYDHSSGDVTKVVDQAGRSVSFSYSNGNLTQSTDAAGNVRNYTYTAESSAAGPLNGLMTSQILPLGNTPFTQSFDSLGRAVSQTDSRGNATTIAYDQTPGSTVAKDPTSNATAYAAVNHVEFTAYTDPDNQSFAIAYDSSAHRTSVTDRLGAATSRTYDSSSGYVSSETNASGYTTTYTWTAQTQGAFTFFNLTQIQYADGSSASFKYDASGNVASATDQAGDQWTYTYNTRGQRTSATDPLGRVTAYAYNASDATLASVTDGVGNVTAYSYDSAKRVSQIKFADSTTRLFTYDNLDNLLTSTDERSNVTTFAYNANNKFQAATDALGKSATIAYNTDEHVSKETDRTGVSTSFAYDQNQLLSTATTPALESYTFTHDTHHRLASVLDPSSHAVSFAYDKEDVLASMTDALSRKTSFTTDALGYRTKITTPLGENYTIARDTLERVTASIDPSGIATSISYDPRGLASGIAIGGSPSLSLAVALAHDTSGLLTGLTDPNGNAWTFAYDSAGRLGSRADPLHRSTTYSYDQRNRVAGVQTPVGAATFTYDPSGNLLHRLYSDGTNLNYIYDNDNRLLTGPGVALSYDADGRITGSNGLAITRDADGRIASITYAAGKTVTYAYNSVGLLASVTDWVSGSTTFTYDAAHELSSMKRPNGLGTEYNYDADGRIASITEDAGSLIAVTRDAAGKIVSESRTQPSPSVAPGLSAFTFDAAEQVSGSAYDGMGRLTSDPLRTYTWDLASRLSSYQGTNGSATAGYDGLGLRTSETSGGFGFTSAPSNFVWNYATALPTLATVQTGSADQRYYVYTPGGTLLYAIDAAGNARHFYHFDETGSTMLLTNDAGAVTDSYGITPYGETVTQSGTTSNPFTWLGQFGVMQESSAGLYYMRARWYDSATARFLSPDPVTSADPKEVNPYAYARANPIQFADAAGAIGIDLTKYFYQDTTPTIPIPAAPRPENAPNAGKLFTTGFTYLPYPSLNCGFIDGGVQAASGVGPCGPNMNPPLSFTNTGALIAREILFTDPLRNEDAETSIIVSYQPTLTANPPLGLSVLAEPAPAPPPSLRTGPLKTFGAPPQPPPLPLK